MLNMMMTITAEFTNTLTQAYKRDLKMLKITGI